MSLPTRFNLRSPIGAASSAAFRLCCLQIHSLTASSMSRHLDMSSPLQVVPGLDDHHHSFNHLSHAEIHSGPASSLLGYDTNNYHEKHIIDDRHDEAKAIAEQMEPPHAQGKAFWACRRTVFTSFLSWPTFLILSTCLWRFSSWSHFQGSREVHCVCRWWGGARLFTSSSAEQTSQR